MTVALEYLLITLLAISQVTLVEASPYVAVVAEPNIV